MDRISQSRPPRAPRRPPPGRLRFTRRARVIGRLVTGAASALVLVCAGTGWYLHASVLGGLATSRALSGLGGTGGSGDLNILLMGLDSRRDNLGDPLPPATLALLHAGNSSDIGGYNTNTLILLHVPADGSRAVAVSIPRDDLVDLPEGLGRHKIKEAYGRAKAAAQAAAVASGRGGDPAALDQLGREAGRHAAIDAVQSLLGVTVDHFAEINLIGFYDLADALGGVKVCLREPVADPYSGADFPAGVQSLDGGQALAFVRQRHGLPNGDLDRTHRQQAFLASAVRQLRSTGVFGDLDKIRALLDVAHKDLVVDSGFDLLKFARQAGAVTSGQVTFYTLPVEGFTTVGGEQVNVVDPVRIRAVTQRLLSGENADGSVPTAYPTGPALPQVGASGRDAMVGPAAAGRSSAALSGAFPAPGSGSPAPSASAAPAAASASQPPPAVSNVPGVPCVD